MWWTTDLDVTNQHKIDRYWYYMVQKPSSMQDNETSGKNCSFSRHCNLESNEGIRAVPGCSRWARSGGDARVGGRLATMARLELWKHNAAPSRPTSLREYCNWQPRAPRRDLWLLRPTACGAAARRRRRWWPATCPLFREQTTVTIVIEVTFNLRLHKPFQQWNN